ncbi:MAG: cytochrome C [Alphaproteobacteria bacterium]|nr:cytochrome C [Alphaproteobacteria bacterium]MBU1525985.1 cytochrome C [Alphaproteobacteria bacterium]MBU2350393.1 cytochrome C [Alphaproteobacteria bacterium]MBU2381627.1 cytochrome C [Alphaproteobacteria bacterium]
MTRIILTLAGLAAAGALAACDGAGERTVTVTTDGGDLPRVVAPSDVEAGRYLVKVGGCNDCHTPRYAMTNGAEPPESEWLKGSNEPHTGPWGTSYGKNLRLTTQRLSEDEWVKLMDEGQSLPPMPWPSVRAMSEADRRAIYRYIRQLPGDPGQPAPDPLPPGAAAPPAG